MDCESEEGLLGLGARTKWAAFRGSPGEPDALVAINGEDLTICLRGMSPPQKFVCASEELPGLQVGISAWISPRITKGQLAERLTLIANRSEIPGSAQHARVRAAGLYDELRFSLGYPLAEAKMLFYGDDPPPYDLDPFYFQADWDFGPINLFWSDIYDYWFWDRTPPKPPTCYTICDRERGEEYANCQLGAAVAVAGCGTPVGVVVTIGSANPAAGVAVGAAAGSVCGAVWLASCYARADQYRLMCRLVCN